MKRRFWFWRVSTIVGFALALGFFSSGISSSYATEESSGDNGTDIAAVGAVDGNAADNHDAAAYDTAAAAAAAGEDFDEDPWEGFNEKMFWFNREVLDRYVLKPVATAWDFILPDPVQRGVHNFFDNLAVVRRVVNNGLQAKPMGAATELARFTINSTIGLVGFFDVAKDAFGIEQRDEDTGQTFGVWGAGPGPYLVLPLLPPLTVRDGIGYAFDAAMTPYSYFIPWWGTVAATGTSVVNERSLNLDRFERVAESTVDLYGAVRNAYLQRRAAAIKQ
ncbi:MAG TPA: VacJ family lipoprotein [Candidatus Saccharimonadales bacterium]|nr:VacJ family lipoprotein [Candidatus Saccharimonadales bacterium]